MLPGAAPIRAGAAPPANADTANAKSNTIAARLLAGYPGIVTRVDATSVHFADGTTMPLDDGRGPKSFDAWLAAPDIDDMFALAYPAGTPATPPAKDADPGRARNAAFFEKVYGDCRKGNVPANLADVVWLPKKSGARIKATRINGVAQKLQAVSDALDALPAAFDVYLKPPAGTYNCRKIAGSTSASAHSYGIAIDIATARADYWRWSGGGTAGASGPIRYRNKIPPEIVAIFEQHGFIWGGRWHHYDTMHFEYRPELLMGEVENTHTAPPR
ncbi:MAG: M15 family metallopeptidase [Hyphomicrobium sp.]|nr:M15 family metallopeptidase [Hyphomicrobium sp.]